MPSIDEALASFLLFENMFGPGRGWGGVAAAREKQGPRRSVHLKLTVSIFEAINGATKTVETKSSCRCSACNGAGAVKRPSAAKCPGCGGSGVTAFQNGPFLVRSLCFKCSGTGYSHATLCLSCNGSGYVTRSKSVSLRVPKGTRNGRQLRLSSGGSFVSGSCDDLFVKVHVEPHPRLKWIKDDIHVSVPVSSNTCTFGGSVSVPGLVEGASLHVKIPPNTNPKVPFVLKGRGPPISGRNARGDYVIHFVTQFPQQDASRGRGESVGIGERALSAIQEVGRRISKRLDGKKQASWCPSKVKQGAFALLRPCMRVLSSRAGFPGVCSQSSRGFSWFD